MRILITGSRGRVGSLLVTTLAVTHTVLEADLPEVDLAVPETAAQLAAERPELIIHTAAWTDVDGCARDPERALRINAYGTKHVALACQRLGIPLLHISTNEVFDGSQATPYREYDAPTRSTLTPIASGSPSRSCASWCRSTPSSASRG